MALERLDYGLEIEHTPDQTMQERMAATEHTRAAIRKGDVERINYGGRTIEIAKIDHAALGRPVDKQYERNLASVQNRLNAIGVQAAVVVNFLPIPLRSDSILEQLRKARIRPPRDKEDCSVYVFSEVEIEPVRQGVDAPLIAVDHHPITLAQEFSKINSKGVMSFIGIPSDIDDPAWRNKISREMQHNGRTYGEVLDVCRQDAIAWMQEMLRRGNDNDRLKIAPTEPQKAAARRLVHLGMIKEQPAWVEKQRDLGVKIPMCPSCQRPCEPGACQCTNPNCGFIIDPRKAYEISAIAEDHPALERLTRADVKEMGISDYVAETRDEKVVRLDTGGIKPKSQAAMRVQATEDEFREMEQKRTAEAIGQAVQEARKGKPGKE